MRDRSFDLLAAAVLTVAAALAVYWGAPVAVSSALGIPMVLLAPGYVWTDVLVGSRLSAEMRAALSLALSLTITAVGGVLLYLCGARLDRASWLGLLAGTTLVGAAVAAIVRARIRDSCRAGPRVQRRVQRISRIQAVRLSLAALIGASAVGIAVHSAGAQVQPPFTQLSISRNGAPGTAHVVLGNHEHSTQLYRVVVETDDVTSGVWTVALADGASWQRSVPARPGQRLVVDVYRPASGARPYRFVTMSIPVAQGNR